MHKYDHSDAQNIAHKQVDGDGHYDVLAQKNTAMRTKRTLSVC